MLTEYLAEAMVAERRAELERYLLANRARKLTISDKPSRGWLGSLVRLQSRGRRARRAASTAGHSLSTIE